MYIAGDLDGVNACAQRIRITYMCTSKRFEEVLCPMKLWEQRNLSGIWSSTESFPRFLAFRNFSSRQKKDGERREKGQRLTLHNTLVAKIDEEERYGLCKICSLASWSASKQITAV